MAAQTGGSPRDADGRQTVNLSRRHLPALLLAVAVLAACERGPAPAADPQPIAGTTARGAAQGDADAIASVERWAAARDADLRRPDGWFSYSASGTLDPGQYTVGSDDGSDLVLPKGPARLGVLQLGDDGRLRFVAEPGSGARIDGKPFTSATLSTQLDVGGPTSVEVDATRFYVVRTGDRHGWRFRDPQSPALMAFSGIERFPVDAKWRVVADWEPFEPAREVELVTTLGTLAPAQVPGVARFTVDGRRFALQPVLEEGSDELFFIIADRTSGKQTYGGARFLYAQAPRDGKVVLDFNRAENPPCALNGHVVCPTPPPGNRLDLAVTAGEKTYRGAAEH